MILLLCEYLITGCVVVVVSTYFYFFFCYKHWKKKGVVHTKPIFPFGNVKDLMLFRKHAAEVYAEFYRKFKKHRVIGIYVANRPAVIFSDPELIKTVLIKDFNYFHDRGMNYDEKRDPFSVNLLSLRGELWKNLRTKMTPTFSTGKLRKIFPILTEVAEKLRIVLHTHVETEDEVEMREFAARYSTDVIASCAFGIDSKSLENPNSEFRQWGKKTFEQTLRTAIMQTSNVVFPHIARALRIPFFHADVTEYFTKMVVDNVRYRKARNITRNDFLDLLILMWNQGFFEYNLAEGKADFKTRHGIDPGLQRLASQVFVFYIAGFETSSSTISFCLYELAKHPDVQERVRRELEEVLERYEGSATYEAVQALKYMDQVVNETLRKYPAIPILVREATRDYTVPGTNITLDKGTLTIVPVWAIHRDPEYYPHPEKFDPERFSEGERSNRPPCTFLPFGEGPRMCLGMKLGEFQVKTALAAILRYFEILPCGRTVSRIRVDPKSFLIAADSGIWVKLVPVTG